MIGSENVDAFDAELPLPGIGDETPASASDLERAARRTLAELRKAGHLTEANAVQCQLLLDLCAGYSASVRAARGKVTVAASAVAAQIQNLLAALMPEQEATNGDDDAWSQLVDGLRAAHDDELRRQRSSTVGGDSADT